MYKVYCDERLIYDPSIDALRIFSPRLELELNKTGSFSFTIYPDHPYFSSPEKMKSIITVSQDGFMIFRGRILNEKQGFHNEKLISCEGELAFLCDSRQRPYDFLSGENHTTVSELFTFFITNHNAQVEEKKRFVVGQITVSDPNDYIVRSDSTYLSTWESINSKLVDPLGGYLRVRHEQDGNYIDYLSDFPVVSNQPIEFGVNLLDLSKSLKGEDIATAIIPLGAKTDEDDDASRLTISDLEDEETEDVCKTDDYVYSAVAVERYGWIYRTETWDDITVASNLLSKAKALLSETVNQAVTIELNGVDLAGINADFSGFKLGVYVPVRTVPHGIDANFLVKKLTIDLANPTANKLSLGTTYLSFTEQTNKGNRVIVDGLMVQIDETRTDLENKHNTALRELRQEVSSEITQSSEEILSRVSDEYYLQSDARDLVESISTQFSQTSEAFNFTFNQFKADMDNVQAGNDAQFKEISKYIRFVNGDIVLGEDGNQLTLKIENDRISFLEDNVVIAYWQNRKFYAVDGEFINSLKLGNFAFVLRSNGNLSFKKVN